MHAHLLACRTCRAEVASVEAVEARLRSAFGGEVPPPELWLRIATDLRAQSGGTASLERRQPAGYLSRRVAIGVGALLAIGVVLAGRRLVTNDVDSAELMRTPVDEMRSFIDSGRPVDIATADPVQLRQWFVPRVDFPPPTPPTKAGLSLVGGRLCYFFGRRIAAYMYQADSQILSLYVMSDRDIEPPFDRGVMLGGRPTAIREIGGFAHVLWKKGRLYYALVSGQPASRLADVAREIMFAIG